jgi:Spy/CpxP family protein refolding chaperone
MKRGMLLSAGFAVALLVGSAALHAADDAAKPDNATPTHVTRGGRLVKPWSDLKDLTSEQTEKLKEIHAKSLAQMSEIRAKEKEECMAVLTDDQKKELADDAAKTLADRKAKAATAPSDSTK